MLRAVVNDERDSESPEDEGERHRRAAEDERRRERLQHQIDRGEIPWSRVRISVDGHPVEFEVLSVGECSAAVAFLDETNIAIWSRRVELDHLQLARDGSA